LYPKREKILIEGPDAAVLGGTRNLLLLRKMCDVTLLEARQACRFT
jgi:hypothetical protein